jgi:hypothetical protein
MRREQLGKYLIEASASRLPGNNKWQPRLTITRLAEGTAMQKCQAFPGLVPVFETAAGATQYALDLGRTMTAQGSKRLTV